MIWGLTSLENHDNVVKMLGDDMIQEVLDELRRRDHWISDGYVETIYHRAISVIEMLMKERDDANLVSDTTESGVS